MQLSEYQMYCNSTYQCLMTTITIGLRSAGGLGEFLTQPLMENEEYMSRYGFDLGYFVIINIFLLDIFLILLIDGFNLQRSTDFNKEF